MSKTLVMKHCRAFVTMAWAFKQPPLVTRDGMKSSAGSPWESPYRGHYITLVRDETN